MKKKFKNKMRMYRGVYRVLIKNNSIWDGHQAMEQALVLLNQKMLEMEAVNRNRSVIIAGVTKTRDERRLQAATKANVLANALYAMAKSNKDIVLMEQVRITKSQLQYGSLAFLLDKMDVIIEHAANNVNSLAGFGIQQSDIDDLLLLQMEVNEMANSPRTAIVERKVMTEKLEIIVKQIDAVIKDEIDRYMVQFEVSHPDFFHNYQGERIIIDLKGLTKREPEAPNPSSTDTDVAPGNLDIGPPNTD